MVVVDTYEISYKTRREWWTGKVGQELVLEGLKTEMFAKDAKVVKVWKDGEEAKAHVEVTYY